MLDMDYFKDSDNDSQFVVQFSRTSNVLSVCSSDVHFDIKFAPYKQLHMT